jgi:methionine synthase II (cobalamin-independent)
MRDVLFSVGMSTGIGSLPHDDPDDAARFALDWHPRLPAAPSLPRRSATEGMIAQAAWGIAGVLVLDDGSLLVDEATIDPAVPLVDPGVDGEPFVAFRTFLDHVAGRVAPFKLQLTGPVTLALALHAVGVEATRAFAVAGQAVTARIEAALLAARQAAPGATPVLFLDEPGLTAALDPGFPFDLDDTLDLVSSAMAVVEEWAIAGLHCCGRADWQAVLQAGPQILSLPVGAGAVEHAGALAGFLDRGGWVAWGAVPTDGPLTTSADVLWRHLRAEWDTLAAGGCDPALLRERAIITPACGLVGFELHQAEQVAGLAANLAQRLEAQVLGTGSGLDVGT